MPRIEKANKNKNSTPEANRRIRQSTLGNDNSLAGAGFACTPKFEPLPQFIAADCEKVISQANSYIVLGRDRTAGRLSGYGGLGATGAHSIDLVVGRSAPGAPEDEQVYVDPNFSTDAARIYISEKTDVDENFFISSRNSINSVSRSAIALKADAVRIIAEDSGIKLVTGIGGRNSNGRLVSRVYGVDLIGDNDDRDLQPMVKGHNLVEFLGKIIDQINDTNGLVMELTNALSIYQLGLLLALGFPWPSSAGALTPSQVRALISNLSITLKGVTQKTSLAINTINYLTSVGNKDILSSYHRVN